MQLSDASSPSTSALVSLAFGLPLPRALFFAHRACARRRTMLGELVSGSPPDRTLFEER
jgi:hypothetical protein